MAGNRESHSLGEAAASQLKVELGVGGNTEHCRATDVGRRGLFLLTEHRFEEQQLVHLKITLPRGKTVTIHGMVERYLSAEAAGAAGTFSGIGVRFYGLGLQATELWEGFIADARDATAGATEEELDDAVEIALHEPTEEAEPIAPQDATGHSVYRLLIPSSGEVMRFADTALEVGGVFVETDDIRPPGTPVVVCVVHPDTQAEFHLPGTICPNPEERMKGVAVALSNITLRTVAEFRSFADPDEGPPVEPSPEAAAATPELATDLSQGFVPEEGSETMSENTQELTIADLGTIVVEPTPIPRRAPPPVPKD